ncbi:MAG: bifunctional oligoribonuclease/PAP phosphatase NrnA [Bacteroidia bacterium]|nr:bifunctional oligoribonuclease/PAP phosphatase NrnA [Bacteroidia bacterium]
MNHLTEIGELLSSPKRIAITTHLRPDGDAMGSSLGLYHYLIGQGHKVKVVAPTDYADFIKWLPGTSEVIIAPDDMDHAKWTMEGADLIFCLDFNALHRVQDLEAVVRDSEGKKILIDHHMDPDGFEDLRFWDDKASSTAELIYRLIDGLGHLDQITFDVAECLYTGIMTDTGSFRFTSTTPAVHRLVARLLETGISPTAIYDRVMSTSTLDRLKFLGHCLSERLRFLPEYKTAYLMVPQEVFKAYNVKSGDTEGLVNYALGMKGVNLGVLMTVQDNLVKMSFRSRGGVNSAELASNFSGGGHFYASGGRSNVSLEDTEKKLLELLEANKAMLMLDELPVA